MPKETLEEGLKLYQDALDEWVCLDETHKAVSDFIIHLNMIEEHGRGKLAIGYLKKKAGESLGQLNDAMANSRHNILRNGEFIDRQGGDT